MKKVILIKIKNSYRSLDKHGFLISLICFAFLAGIASPSLAELSCGDPGSCVITFHWYYERNIAGMSVVLQTMDGVDGTCKPLYSRTTGINPPSTPLHENVYIKYYWNGSAWRVIKIFTGAAYVLGENTTPGIPIPKVTWSFGTNPDWNVINNPSLLFPEGCLSLAKPEQNFGGFCPI
jgi:hypothetical protein